MTRLIPITMDIFHILEVVLRYLRYVGSWLSFQVLLPQDTFELFEHTLSDVTSKLYAKLKLGAAKWPVSHRSHEYCIVGQAGH